MKRFGNILQKMTLTQQLMTVVLVSLSFFIVFVFVFIFGNINTLVKEQLVKSIHDDQQMIINNFLAGASTDIFRVWISSGKKVPMDDVIQLTGRLLESGASSLRTPQNTSSYSASPKT